MKRRTFLKSAAAGLALAPASGAASLLPAQASPAFAVLTGVGHGTSIPHLITVLDAFVDRAIPLTCIVSPFDRDGRPLAADSKLAQVLNGYLLGNSGLEVAPYVRELPLLSEYFQARNMHDTVLAVQDMLRPALAARNGSLLVQTVACADAENPLSPRGARSAGVVNVLSVPSRSGRVRSETWDNGVVRLFGGRLQPLKGGASPLLQGSGATGQQLIYLSAEEFADLPAGQLAEAAGQLAGRLSQQEVDGDVSLLPVSDVQLRDDYGFRRSICLHVLRPAVSGGAEMQAYTGFTEFLTQAGIPYSTGADEAEEAGASGFWVPTEALQEAESAEAGPAGMSAIRVDFTGREGPASVTAGHPLTPGIGVVLAEGSSGQQGLDAAGLLQLEKHVISGNGGDAALKSVLEGTGDAVVFIRPGSFDFPPDRKALEGRLAAMHAGGTVAFTLIEDFARKVAPSGPLPVRHRRTAAAVPELRVKRARLDGKTREELLEDARVAWRYFEKFTNRKTGLCPATVNFAPGGRLHQAVTMWDVGSQINGLVAAAQIGLISRPDFEAAIRRILPNIAGRVSQERRLPQGWIRTDRHKWGNKNFDGSDAGRLLASLDNLRRHSTFGDQLAELVGSWDLQKVIIGGEIFSVTDGELKTSYVSHSAHYSARAFRRWGLEVRSPYEVFAGRSAMDGQMALLEAAARIGPIGAEPLLLEAMELGMSPESSYLADVLFSAQVEDFRETGRMICVSEGPIDRPPWFLYQGLQLDARERTWAFDTVGQEAEFRTAAFRKEHLALSSKAAYLWFAYQPHSYSGELFRFTRGIAKTENGFSSSVYLKGNQPTASYTDLNTNGVILQAIANRLANAA